MVSNISTSVKKAVGKTIISALGKGLKKKVKSVKRAVGAATGANIKQLLRSGSAKTTRSSKIRAGKAIVDQVLIKARYKRAARAVAPFVAVAGSTGVSAVGIKLIEQRKQENLPFGKFKGATNTAKQKLQGGYKMVFGKIRRVRGS